MSVFEGLNLASNLQYSRGISGLGYCLMFRQPDNDMPGSAEHLGRQPSLEITLEFCSMFVFVRQTLSVTHSAGVERAAISRENEKRNGIHDFLFV